MNSLGLSSSFFRRWTVSASRDRTYAWRSCTWISYSVSRRRLLVSDMEAGRNFENPSRFGLLRFSNSFIAHPFSRMPCEPLARHSRLTEYRRLQKRKSRLHASLAGFECPDFLRFPPALPLSCTFSHDDALRYRVEQVLYRNA